MSPDAYQMATELNRTLRDLRDDLELEGRVLAVWRAKLELEAYASRVQASADEMAVMIEALQELLEERRRER